ncbi:MAG TPA: sulfotransferase [Candidatus Baltobacteraceae bacterium]|jgi:tetratricopeptide (TPR) repeat protein|nr:sulfotransferase [Candidatus Baltobacteraceae bacterium]
MMQSQDAVATGRAAWAAGDVLGALRIFEAATAAGAEYAEASALAGVCLASLGRTDEAKAAIRRAIAREPRQAQFYRYLTDVDPGALREEDVAALESLAAADPADVRIEANFALGKYFARRDPDRSFDHLVRGNAEKRALCSYDEAATLTSFQRIATVFQRPFIESGRKRAESSELPVFIFGMPRSGTTLVEQILASHSMVHGAGELSLLEDTVESELGDGAPITAAIGQRYAGELRALEPRAKRITDKNPLNFRYAGLIAMVMPNARMVHVRRDPLDTCVSCFSNIFAGASLAWTYDLGELARYYNCYRRLMEHWRAALPDGAMFEMAYEDLVDDPEVQVRRLLAHCGLAWEQRCLSFYTTQRSVQTASATQVRKPLYRDSVKRSRAYGELLQPLRGALGIVDGA